MPTDITFTFDNVFTFVCLQRMLQCDSIVSRLLPVGCKPGRQMCLFGELSQYAANIQHNAQ